MQGNGSPSDSLPACRTASKHATRRWSKADHWQHEIGICTAWDIGYSSTSLMHTSPGTASHATMLECLASIYVGTIGSYKAYSRGKQSTTGTAVQLTYTAMSELLSSPCNTAWRRTQE